jgi:hypothetical protein
VEGEGRFQLLSPEGFAAELDVALVPLDLGR